MSDSRQDRVEEEVATERWHAEDVAARAEALEEAARVCDAHAHAMEAQAAGCSSRSDAKWILERAEIPSGLAAAIRALKDGAAS